MLPIIHPSNHPPYTHPPIHSFSPCIHPPIHSPTPSIHSPHPFPHPPVHPPIQSSTNPSPLSPPVHTPIYSRNPPFTHPSFNPYATAYRASESILSRQKAESLSPTTGICYL